MCSATIEATPSSTPIRPTVAETFGDPSDPPILLIMGAGGSMPVWDEKFCKRVANCSRLVIRYDNGDTGRSVTYPPGAPEYTRAGRKRSPTPGFSYLSRPGRSCLSRLGRSRALDRGAHERCDDQ
jgi:hypothetical protein